MRFLTYISQKRLFNGNMVEAVNVWVCDNAPLAEIEKEIRKFEEERHFSMSYVLTSRMTRMASSNDGKRILKDFIEITKEYASDILTDVEVKNLEGLASKKVILNFINGKGRYDTLGKPLHFKLGERVIKMNRNNALHLALYTVEFDDIIYLRVISFYGFGKGHVMKLIQETERKVVDMRISLIAQCDIPFGSHDLGGKRLKTFKGNVEAYVRNVFGNKGYQMHLNDLPPYEKIRKYLCGENTIEKGYYARSTHAWTTKYYSLA